MVADVTKTRNVIPSLVHNKFFKSKATHDNIKATSIRAFSQCTKNKLNKNNGYKISSYRNQVSFKFI